MLTRSKIVSILLATLTLPICARAELDDDEVARLQKLLAPSKTELWRTIPWKISVLDAQATAAEEGKPIFIWAMDGHPLGCT